MAGRFLSLEEAARQLGVTVDDVNRLVDRKKLFPMRDGATVKFKADDIERVARDLGEEHSQSDDLSLDLELPTSPVTGGSGSLDLDDLAIGEPIEGMESIFSAEASGTPSVEQTNVRGGSTGDVSGLSMPSQGSAAGGSEADVVFGDRTDGGGLDSDDLALESIIGASSPSLARQAPPSAAGSETGSTLAIDMSDIGKGGMVAGSATGVAGSALSGALDSGLSLEDGDVQLQGLGDEFQLGGDGGDEESASVVIATEESGDSSFFGAALEGEGSSLSEESLTSADSASVIMGGEPGEYTFDTPFSALQIAGLVCCSLLLLLGGFVLFDLVRTVGSSEGPMLANPILNAMAETFGWRR